MKTSKHIGLLIAAMVVLKGTCAYAQSDLADKYAWRLDSVVYSYPTYTLEDDPEEVRPDHYTAYRYTDDTLEVISVERDTWHDTTYMLMPTKTLYTKVDSGLYQKESMRAKRGYYETFDSLQYVEYRDPAQKELYMKDSVRNVYDEEGRLIRQIRNYDYITFRLNTVYDEQTGMTTGMEWTPYNRTVRTENDSVSVDYTYKYNASARKWETKSESVVRNSYRNHILYMSVRESNYTYHENGEIASLHVDISEYNPMGIDTLWIKAEIKRNTEGKNTYERETVTTRKDPVARTRETSYTYDEQGNLVSTDNIERRIDRATNLCISEIHSERSGKVCLSKQEREWIIRTRPMRSIGAATTLLTLENNYSNDSLKRHHCIRYDENYNIALEVDSFINSQGMWCYERKEYDAEGDEIYTVSSREDPAYGGWTIFSEEDHRPAEYYKLLLVNRQGWSVNGGAYHYDTIRETQLYYSNKFDMSRKREKLNTANFTWRLLNYNREQTTFNSDGTPASTIEYISNDPEGNIWEEKYLYTFTYDEELGLYLRIKTAEMADNGDGTKSWQTLAQPLPDWYYKLGGGKAGMEREYYAEVQEDIEGHQAHLYYYNYVDSTASWELTYREDVTYFPEPDCKKEASRYFWRKENSSMVVPGNRTEGLELFTDTFDIFDEFGTFTEQHAYHWDYYSTTLICDKIIRNQPTYDVLGRLTQRIEWYTWSNTGNIPYWKYRYFYRPDDGTQYDCVAVSQYGGSSNGWTDFQLTNDGLGDVSYDEQGRAVEQIYYRLDNTATALVPKTKQIMHYEDDNADWYFRETYNWSETNNAWEFANSSYRGAATLPVISLDESGNIVHYELRNEAYNLTYGALLEAEPVLSPASFGIQETNQLLYTGWLNPEAMKARILTAHHVSENKYGLWNPVNAQYMARYYYTQLSAEVDTVKTPTEENLEIEPEENTATFTWPAVSGGASYTLIIWADEAQTEKVCTLHLAADGTLISIDFSKAPRRAPASLWSAPVLSTTIENLLPGTQYWYTLEAYDEVGLLIDTANGTFFTRANTEGIDFIEENGTNTPVKFLRNGQIIIRRNDAEYSIQGNQLK